jgi:hypothetical protein
VDILTRDIGLCLLIDVINNYVVAGGVYHPLVVVVKQVPLDITLESEQHPREKVSELKESYLGVSDTPPATAVVCTIWPPLAA